jgi:hypothetical protein
LYAYSREATYTKYSIPNTTSGSYGARQTTGANYLTHVTPDAKLVRPDISATLAERGGRYGQFIDHAKISQGLQDVMREAPNWNKLDVDMKQALSVIADKIARILNGSAYHSDNFHDIAGYALLVDRRLKDLEDAQKENN